VTPVELAAAAQTTGASVASERSPTHGQAASKRERAFFESWPDVQALLIAVGAIVLVLGAAAFALVRRGRGAARQEPAPSGVLTPAEREQLLKNVEAWMRVPAQSVDAGLR
jgi:hypothetical protein